MRISASAVLVLVACHPGSDDAYPVIPQGDDSPITPRPDAPRADASGDAATTISGRVCVISDLRNLTSCTTADASGISVELSSGSATTIADGSFTIAAAVGSNLTWSVTGTGYVQTVMPLGTIHLLPLVPTVVYQQLLLDNGVIQVAGEGSVVARVVRNDAPAVGVTATVTPPSQYGPLYDGASGVIWDQDMTAAAGVVWIPDVLQGAASLTLTAPSATPVTVSVPTLDQAITFATVVIL